MRKATFQSVQEGYIPVNRSAKELTLGQVYRKKTVLNKCKRAGYAPHLWVSNGSRTYLRGLLERSQPCTK